jgi:putative pyruvate formate lyase activating enzyme
VRFLLLIFRSASFAFSIEAEIRRNFRACDKLLRVMSLQHFLAVRDGFRLPLLLQNAVRLDEKIARVESLYNSCDICPHDCRVNRNAGKVGFCGVADESAIHWEGVLHGEEIELVPSHEVFLSGCTMRCAFCYSHEHITKPMSGVKTSPHELASCAQKRFAEGATNLNLVGGDPTVHLLTILRALKTLRAPTPIVWNSNMYIASHAMEILDGVVDLFLGDIHFGNNECAQKLGRIPQYFETVTNALQAASASKASVIIRHLLMPGHLECCAKPAMEWARSTLPAVPFHLMFQYVPDYRAVGDAVLGRVLSREEIKAAQKMAREIGVNLYEENAEIHGAVSASVLTKESAIGETVDVLIHDDGRVSFTRLTSELLPIAAALNDEVRVARRTQKIKKEAHGE